MGQSPQSLKARLERGTLKGWPPHSENNPFNLWAVDADELDREEGPLGIACVYIDDFQTVTTKPPPCAPAP
jgi:hypothetical protein